MRLTRRRFMEQGLLLLASGWIAPRQAIASTSTRPEHRFPAYGQLERENRLAERIEQDSSFRWPTTPAVMNAWKS